MKGFLGILFTVALIACVVMFYGKTPFFQPATQSEKPAQVTDEIKSCQSTRRLREAVVEFESIYGRLPASLEELVKENVLTRMPGDPTRRGWNYDPNTGEVMHNVYRGC